MKKRILVAPLNWGMGHATRCIPIINALIEHNFEPIIASDGQALQLLKKEFKSLIFVELPGYNVKYSKTKKGFRWIMLWQLPKIKKAIKKERKAIKKIIHDYAIEGLISDNRMGVYSRKVPSVFITHQLNVLSGNTTKLSTFFHDTYLKEFNECWIPDFENEPNLSGKLGHDFNKKDIQLQYIGALSRLQQVETKQRYKIMVLLSGPEPQRGILEKKLIKELKNYKHPILFVKGIIEKKQKITVKDNITFYNFMQTEALQDAINSSGLILSRSGYTTIMDLAKLSKHAFFIPTPGQFEQEYLAKYLAKNGIIPFCNQDEFTLKQLDSITNYSGFKGFENQTDFKTLFSLF